jgi:hypothetical protein
LKFKSSDVETITGVKRVRLYAWIERGFLRAGKLGKGTGTHNLFDEFDVYTVALLKTLIDSGLPRKLAGEITGSIALKGYAEYCLKKNVPLWLVVVLEKDTLKKSWVHIPSGLTGETLGPVGTKTPQALEADMFEMFQSGSSNVSVDLIIDLRKVIDPIQKKLKALKNK